MMFADTGLVQELLRRFANAQLRANRIQLLSKRRYSAFRAGSVASSARLLAFAARSRHFLKLSSNFLRRMIVRPPCDQKCCSAASALTWPTVLLFQSPLLLLVAVAAAFDNGRQDHPVQDRTLCSLRSASSRRRRKAIAKASNSLRPARTGQQL